MYKKYIERLWMFVMLVALVSTYPTWANKPYSQMSSYDAPWVYPALNPVVRQELQQK